MLAWVSMCVLMGMISMYASESSDSDSEIHHVQEMLTKIAQDKVQRRDAMVRAAFGDNTLDCNLLPAETKELVLVSFQAIQRVEREQRALECMLRRLAREKDAARHLIDAIKCGFIAPVTSARVGKGKAMGQFPSHAGSSGFQRISAQNLAGLAANSSARDADIAGAAAVGLLGTDVFAGLPSQMPSALQTSSGEAGAPRIVVAVQSPSQASTIQGVGEVDMPSVGSPSSSQN